MINIIIKDYNEDEKVMYIKRGEDNIWGMLSIMQFEDELEFYGISIKRKKVNDEIGYVFNKNIDESLVYEETKRFLDEHDIENLKMF